MINANIKYLIIISVPINVLKLSPMSISTDPLPDTAEATSVFDPLAGSRWMTGFFCSIQKMHTH